MEKKMKMSGVELDIATEILLPIIESERQKALGQAFKEIYINASSDILAGQHLTEERLEGFYHTVNTEVEELLSDYPKKIKDTLLRVGAKVELNGDTVNLEPNQLLKDLMVGKLPMFLHHFPVVTQDEIVERWVAEYGDVSPLKHDE